MNMVKSRQGTISALGQTRKQREDHDLALELREPLSGIRVLLDVLVREGHISAKAQADVNSINHLLDKADEVVNRSISTRRPDLRPPERKAVDLNTIAHETFSVFVATARSGNRLDLNLSTGALPVCGDSKQLSRVVYNLILNALEAVGKPGRVEVRTGKVEGEAGQPGLVFLEVADDGPGIPEDLQRRIGEPVNSTKKQGSGLGLAIAKRIVEAHQGVFNVESPRRDLERGTRIRLFVPELFEYQI